MSIAKQLLSKFESSSTVELEDFHKSQQSTTEIEKIMSDNWPHKITYKGKSLFDNYVEGSKSWVDQLSKVAEIGAVVTWDYEDEGGDSGSETVGGQECYLGYKTDTDTFIMGFDIFAEGRIEGASVEFKVISGKDIKVIDTSLYNRGGFYSEEYKKLKSKNRNLVDLRLD